MQNRLFNIVLAGLSGFLDFEMPKVGLIKQRNTLDLCLICISEFNSRRVEFSNLNFNIFLSLFVEITSLEVANSFELQRSIFLDIFDISKLDH
jgi:hypothetical protein